MEWQDTSTQQALTIAKTYHLRNNFRASLAIITNYVIITSSVALSHWITVRSCWPLLATNFSYMLSILIIASRMRALENLVHEASHNNLFSTAPLHRRLQALYAFPVFRLLEDYRHSHMMHHKHLGDPQKDPDVVRFHELGLDRLPEHPIWYLFGLPMTGYLTYEYTTTTFREFWQSSSSRWSKSIFWTAVILIVVFTRTPLLFMYYYLIPLLVVLPVTRYWAEASEHIGLDLTEDFGSSRTNIGWLHAWYMNPHNDGYHAVHHLYSQIPFHLLPEAHEHLMDASKEFAQRSEISHGILETFRNMASTKTVFKVVADSG